MQKFEIGDTVKIKRTSSFHGIISGFGKGVDGDKTFLHLMSQKTKFKLTHMLHDELVQSRIVLTEKTCKNLK